VKRIAAILLVVCATAAVLVSGTAAGGDEGGYEVRAIFDNAGFLVTGEDVRVAGAKVGSVVDIDVTGADEIAHDDGTREGGKAVVVMRIDDPAFHDFREDASCLIRPQSLIGEKFVECEPTQPRAAASVEPPAIEPIPDGEAGEGQYLLPVERNGKAVDLDLVNNIMKEPYPDRFRLILNDLGAGLAARGEELGEIIERANPALRETNEVLAILARQNRALSGLARDGDAILSALARERDSVVGFINSATVAGEATAERREEMEESFAKLPGFLRELRSTMVELDRFSGAATPVFSDLGDAAPSLTRLNRAVEPFSSAATGALTSLGDASEESAPALVASDPVIRQLRDLGTEGAPATKNTAKLLSTFRKTDGFEFLLRTIFGASGSVNAFDSYGHFLRALIPVNNCFDYTSVPQAGCDATFVGPVVTSAPGQKQKRSQRDGAQGNAEVDSGGGLLAPLSELAPEGSDRDAPRIPEQPSEPRGLDPQTAPNDGVVGSGRDLRAAKQLLDFLIESGDER
jgi:phospholipid/cholesterol/gamma-HCH transport system substrate-binding protein